MTMAKIDEVVAVVQEGHGHYQKYNITRAAVEELQKKLDFKVGKTPVSFRTDWSGVKVFVGSADFTQAEAVTLAKGLLERLTDLTFDDTGSEA